MKFNQNSNPEVTIGLHEEDADSVTIYVKDNGIGIEKEFADRIFELFQRLHSRDEYEGTGLGLAICKKIVTRHNDSIQVDSIPDKDTTF